MLNPYTTKENLKMAKKNVKKVQRVAIEGVVLGETKDDKLLIGFYPDTKANLLEINEIEFILLRKKSFYIVLEKIFPQK